MAKSTDKSGIRFYVQPVRRDGKRYVMGQLREVANEAAARELADHLRARAAGVVAYAVELEEDGDLVGEPRVIATHGTVPGLEVQDMDAA